MTIIRTGFNERGVAFVEAAVILGVFLFLIIGFIDLSRMMWIQSQLSVAADQALTVAATDPGIDYYDLTGKGHPQEYLRAEERVLNKAKEVALSGGLNEEKTQISSQSINLSRIAAGAPPGSSMEQLLESHPLEVSLTSEYEPILPGFGSITLRGRAVGFREPRKIATMPVIVDCNGNLLGSPMYEKNPCPCPVDKMWDFSKKKCVCRNNPANDGTCGCDPLRELSPDFTTCQCKAQSCLIDHIQNTDTCLCQCNLTGAVTAQCQCADNTLRSGNQCNCITDGLPPYTTRTGSSCSLQCLNGNFQPIGGNVNNGCECRLGMRLSGNNCICDSDYCSTQGWTNAFRNSNCTTCGCGGGSSLVGEKTCGCPNSNYVFNESNGCECSQTPCSDAPNQFRNSSNACACQCAPGAVIDDGLCRCTDPNRVLSSDNRTCVCRSTPLTACKSDEVWNTSLCQCVCRSGHGTPGNCSCPGVKIDPNQTGECVCPGTPPAGGWLSGDNCIASCPDGRVLFENKCVFPQCAVPGCRDFIASDGSCNCPEGTAV
jgi:hypothetical protein